MNRLGQKSEPVHWFDFKCRHVPLIKARFLWEVLLGTKGIRCFFFSKASRFLGDVSLGEEDLSDLLERLQWAEEEERSGFSVCVCVFVSDFEGKFFLN